MNVMLQIEFVSYEGRNDAKNYVELKKHIELPFAPTPGLQILLPTIDEEHPDNEEWETILEASNGNFPTGIFEVSNVLFDLEIGLFRVKIDSISDVGASSEAVQLLAQQLIIGYGFERKELY